MATHQNYYSNPAFTQQSEYPSSRPPRALSPQGSTRQSPLGAQAIPRIVETPVSDDAKNPDINDGLEEQEFYEEVLVDNKGFITDKKFVVVAQNIEGKKYIQVPQTEDNHGSRYGTPQPVKPRENKIVRSPSQRYEYIQLQEHASRIASPTTSPQKNQYYAEQSDQAPGQVHRYAVIDAEEMETELPSKSSRYALVPVDRLNNIVTASQHQIVVPQSKSRYEYVQDHQRAAVHQSPNRYEFIQYSPPKAQHRYEYIQQVPRSGNPIATQKLHELLSTPKKSTPVRNQITSVRKLPHSPIAKEFQTKTPPKVKDHTPRAQQKLNYALGTRQISQLDKRHTAVVAPICSSPVQSVYSETTYSNKSESWMNLSVTKAPVQATLAVAAVMMLFCGGITSGLCFYMISVMGRHYFLDFGVVAGFTCLILGLLGFRSRNVFWLPNRNYISGYLVLSVFSLLTCAGLLLLLVKQPRAGTPLADITSGAVCGISVLSLWLAMTGVVSSYCCKYPRRITGCNTVQKDSPSEHF